MLNELQDLINQVLGRTDISLTEKTKIRELESISSLAMIQIVMALEKKYNIEIPNRMILKFRTIKDVIDFIQSEERK